MKRIIILMVLVINLYSFEDLTSQQGTIEANKEINETKEELLKNGNAIIDLKSVQKSF